MNISKICKIHGELKPDRIRVNVRKELVCKDCDKENARKYRQKDIIKHRKICKEWRVKNPDKRRKYDEKYKEKRKIKDKRLKQKWMKNPEYVLKVKEWAIKSRAKLSSELSDSYVKNIILDHRQVINKELHRERLKVSVPQEIIDLKRMQLKLKRAIRKKK